MDTIAGRAAANREAERLFSVDLEELMRGRGPLLPRWKLGDGVNAQTPAIAQHCLFADFDVGQERLRGRR